MREKDYTLSQQYALIGLDGLDSLHPTVVKKAAVRGIKAARILEKLTADLDEGSLNAEGFKACLLEGTAEIKKLGKKEARELEREAVAPLEEDGAMEEIPDLLACDMNYYTSGIDIKTYRADSDLYIGITERVRAEILEEGAVSLEGVCLLWLFRECGCLHELFSGGERDVIRRRMQDVAAENPVYNAIWGAEFHNSVEMGVKNLLRNKKEFFKSSEYGQGVALAFPMLERRQAIFVDFVIFNTTVKERRIAMMEFIQSKGHYVEEIKRGPETLLKIDNGYYRIIPGTVTCARVPIQGARLSPVYR